MSKIAASAAHWKFADTGVRPGLRKERIGK